METLTSYLPQGTGLLPKWLLFVSLVSVANSIQAYTTLQATQRVYLGPRPPPSTRSSKSSSPSKNPSFHSPVTPLSARTFGTWTFITSIVRLYAAYYTSNPQIYQIAFATYAVAFGHFVSEWLIFGTARLGAGLAGPLVVSTGSLVWMWLQWDFYVGS